MAKLLSWIVLPKSDAVSSTMWSWATKARLAQEGRSVAHSVLDLTTYSLEKKSEVVIVAYPGWKRDAYVKQVRAWADTNNISLRVMDPETWTVISEIVAA